MVPRVARPDEAGRLLAAKWEELGERPRAISLLRRLARSHGAENPEVWTDLGTYQAREAFPDEALASFRKALQLDSTHVGALFGMANVLRATNRRTEAAGYLQQLVALHPRVPLFLNELGTLYMSMRNFIEARRFLERAVILDPDYGLAQENLKTLSQMEREAEALVVPEEMRIAPGDTLWTLSQEMVRALSAGDSSGLDSLAEVARRIRPEHILADVMQGVARMQRGRYKEAIPYLEAAVRKAPGRASLVQQLAGCYVALGRAEQALEVVKAALEQSPDETNRQALEQLKVNLEQRILGQPQR
jgi:tetratricopeptide (TPR) repeat protein